MKLAEAINIFDVILKNGPLGTRLKYDYKIEKPVHLAIRDEHGQQALEELYRGDIAIAQAQHLPIIIHAGTFRASKNHLPKECNIKEVNLTCVDFLQDIKDSYQHLNAPIFIGGPIGSMNDAYSVDPYLTAEIAKQYHQEQVSIFAEAKVDVIYAVTISNVIEALGIALAAQETTTDYLIGFFLNQNGTLLDGTPLYQAITEIDQKTRRRPLGYLVTCTHASILLELDSAHKEYQRLIGIQTNGSSLNPSVLDQLKTHVADSPEKFAQDLKQLKSKFGLKILAGCCGTTKEHLLALAKII
ncbi:MAG: homocysteine methyltransferase [Burkholderiales bacterium]|jgi:S-methylmethionine-dependent homocysteine/selenocysteine methylase|nr:homocysteine methyltransferase [Burkholderiales bacterium]